MRRIASATLIFFCSAAVLAAPSVQDALALERSVWLIRTGFHQLALGGNAPDDRETLEQHLTQGRQALVRFVTALDDVEQAKNLEQQWALYEQRAQNNPLASLGYADFEALSELNRLAWLLSRATEPFASSSETLDNKIMRARAMLHRVSSEYLALASFPSAGLNNSIEGAEHVVFEDEVLQLEQLLTDLQSASADSGARRRLLSQVQLRWSFVRDSLLEMEQAEVTRVPMLLYRYSLQIDRDLARLAEMRAD